MGKKLLRTMGWREGQGVGSRVRRKRRRFEAAEGDVLLEQDLPERALAGLGKTARELLDKEGLTFAPKNADLKTNFVTAKTNLHGVGHEPFKDAPEFVASRGAIRGTAAGRGVYSTEDLVQNSSDAGISRRTLAAAALDRGSHGFVLDDGEDDVYESGLGKEAYDEALDEATHDNLTSSAKAWALDGASGEDEPMLASRRYARCPSDGRLPPTGFVVAQRPDVQQKHWAPPIPPASFRPTPEFDKDVAGYRSGSKSQRHGGSGLDASGRARLLGEPSHERIPTTSAAPPASLDESKPLAEGSALSFLPPAARMKVLEAANGARAPARFPSPSGAASPPFASAGATTAEHSLRKGGASRQVNVLPFCVSHVYFSKVQGANVHPTSIRVELPEGFAFNLISSSPAPYRRSAMASMIPSTFLNRYVSTGLALSVFFFSSHLSRIGLWPLYTSISGVLLVSKPPDGRPCTGGHSPTIGRSPIHLGLQVHVRKTHWCQSRRCSSTSCGRS